MSSLKCNEEQILNKYTNKCISKKRLAIKRALVKYLDQEGKTAPGISKNGKEIGPIKDLGPNPKKVPKSKDKLDNFIDKNILKSSNKSSNKITDEFIEKLKAGIQRLKNKGIDKYALQISNIEGRTFIVRKDTQSFKKKCKIIPDQDILVTNTQKLAKMTRKILTDEIIDMLEIAQNSNKKKSIKIKGTKRSKASCLKYIDPKTGEEIRIFGLKNSLIKIAKQLEIDIKKIEKCNISDFLGENYEEKSFDDILEEIKEEPEEISEDELEINEQDEEELEDELEIPEEISEDELEINEQDEKELQCKLEIPEEISEDELEINEQDEKELEDELEINEDNEDLEEELEINEDDEELEEELEINEDDEELEIEELEINEQNEIEDKEKLKIEQIPSQSKGPIVDPEAMKQLENQRKIIEALSKETKACLVK